MKIYIKNSSSSLWNEKDMISYGEELYNAYGPDVDTMDMEEYDADCYLAYKRTIGEA